MERFLPILLEGALVSAEVMAGALVVATVLGLLLALASLSPNRLIYGFARSWIELIRGTPALTVQAGAMSTPILEQLGFVTVARTEHLRDRF